MFISDFTATGSPDEMGVAFGILFYLVYFLVLFGIGIVAYVFQSLAFYSIAKRRGINRPWLSWLPVGNMWILGCISDQYRYVAKGQVKNKRKSLLILNIIFYVIYAVFFAVYAVFMVMAISMADSSSFGSEETTVVILALVMLVVALVMLGIAIAMSVLTYMALYDLFVSCDPDNGVLYLVLSILLGVAQPICLFICRKKDIGMPPRRAAAPVFVPQPVYQPAQPPVEPVPVQEVPVEEPAAEEAPAAETPEEE